MTTTTDQAHANIDRDKRRDEFNRVFESIEGDDNARIQKVCDILGYRPHTVRVLRCRANAWKVIPQAKLDILKRELQREAQASAAAKAA